MATTPTFNGYELNDLAFQYEAGELRSVTATILVEVTSEETNIDPGPEHPWGSDVNEIIERMTGAGSLSFPIMGTSFDLQNYPDCRLRGIFGRGFVLKNDSGSRQRYYRVDLVYRFHPQTKKYPRHVSTGLLQDKESTGVDGEPFAIPLSDGSETQVAVDKLAPQTSTSLAVLIATNAPEDTTKQYAGTVNSQPWRGGDIGEWLCTNVDAELVDASRSPIEYEFRFDFEFREGGWKGFAQTQDSTITPAVTVFGEFENLYVRTDFASLFPADPDITINLNDATV